MATTALTLDPADLYLARLDTNHSRRTARSALTTVAGLLDADTVDWSSVTYAELATVRARLVGSRWVLGGVGQHVLERHSLGGG